MKIEHIYPVHTTEAEWQELALLTAKILSDISASLPACPASLMLNS